MTVEEIVVFLFMSACFFVSFFSFIKLTLAWHKRGKESSLAFLFEFDKSNRVRRTVLLFWLGIVSGTLFYVITSTFLELKNI